MVRADEGTVVWNSWLWCERLSRLRDDAGMVPFDSTPFLDDYTGVHVCTPVFAVLLAVTLYMFLVRVEG